MNDHEMEYVRECLFCLFDMYVVYSHVTIAYCHVTMAYCHVTMAYCHVIMVYCHVVMVYCHVIMVYCHVVMVYCRDRHVLRSFYCHCQYPHKWHAID